MKKLTLLALISLSIILMDYITKSLIIANFSLFDSFPLLPFLKIVHIQNKGAAFGLFKGLGNNVFIFFSVAAIIFIIIYTSKVPVGLEFYSLCLILGGAAGNLLDRLIKGEVTDFIDFFVGDWHWPAFNIADSALTIGMILFLWASLREIRRQKAGHEQMDN